MGTRRAFVAFLTLTLLVMPLSVLCTGCDSEADAESIVWIDSDGDYLPDHLEEEIGTDPERIDTDGDGLTDYVEVYHPDTYADRTAAGESSDMKGDGARVVPASYSGGMLLAEESGEATATPVAPGTGSTPSADETLPVDPDTHSDSGHAVNSPDELPDEDNDGTPDVLDNDHNGDGANDGLSADSDQDGICDSWEVNGWYVSDQEIRAYDATSTPAGTTVYYTNPLHKSTDRDPWTDKDEALGVGLSQVYPGDSPVVAAYPDLVMTMDAYEVTLNEKITTQDGQAVDVATSQTDTVQKEDSFNFHLGVEGGYEDSSAKLVFKGDLTWNAETVTTASKTDSKSIQKTWMNITETDLAKAAVMKANVTVRNAGTYDAFAAAPQGSLSFVSDRFAVAGGLTPSGGGLTIGPGASEAGLVIPDIELTIDELARYNSGNPLALGVTQVNYGKDERLPGIDWGTTVSDINNHTATVIVDDGKGHVRKFKIAAKTRTGASSAELHAPVPTVLQAVQSAYGAQVMDGSRVFVTIPTGDGTSGTTVEIADDWLVAASSSGGSALYDEIVSRGKVWKAHLYAGDTLVLKAPPVSGTAPTVHWTRFRSDTSRVEAFASDYIIVSKMLLYPREGASESDAHTMAWDDSRQCWTWAVPSGYVPSGTEYVQASSVDGRISVGVPVTIQPQRPKPDPSASKSPVAVDWETVRSGSPNDEEALLISSLTVRNDNSFPVLVIGARLGDYYAYPADYDKTFLIPAGGTASCSFDVQSVTVRPGTQAMALSVEHSRQLSGSEFSFDYVSAGNTGTGVLAIDGITVRANEAEPPKTIRENHPIHHSDWGWRLPPYPYDEDHYVDVPNPAYDATKAYVVSMLQLRSETDEPLGVYSIAFTTPSGLTRESGSLGYFLNAKAGFKAEPGAISKLNPETFEQTGYPGAAIYVGEDDLGGVASASITQASQLSGSFTIGYFYWNDVVWGASGTSP